MLIKAFPFQVIDYPEGVILKRGLDQIVISGEGALEKVLLLLTHTSGKTASIEEICNSFAVPDRPGVTQLIQELLKKGFLSPAEHSSDSLSKSQSDIFYEHYGVQQSHIIENLSQLSILLIGINSLSQSIYTNLVKQGVNNVSLLDDPILRNKHYIDSEGKLNEEISPSLSSQIIDKNSFQEHLASKPPRCIIACSDFGGQALLLNWNRFCIQNRIDFLPVYLQDMIGYLGPLIIPGETACLNCVRQRQNSHLRDLEIRNLIEINAAKGQSIAAIHPSAIGVLAHTAVFELMHYYGKMPAPRPGRLIRVNLTQGITESKRVLKIPRCPVCSKLTETGEIQTDRLNPLHKT
jgi:thiazole/oxazole-forming peptide maturase SagC family component